MELENWQDHNETVLIDLFKYDNESELFYALGHVFPSLRLPLEEDLLPLLRLAISAGFIGLNGALRIVESHFPNEGPLFKGVIEALAAQRYDTCKQQPLNTFGIFVDLHLRFRRHIPKLILGFLSQKEHLLEIPRVGGLRKDWSVEASGRSIYEESAIDGLRFIITHYFDLWRLFNEEQEFSRDLRAFYNAWNRRLSRDALRPIVEEFLKEQQDLLDEDNLLYRAEWIYSLNHYMGLDILRESISPNGLAIVCLSEVSIPPGLGDTLKKQSYSVVFADSSSQGESYAESLHATLLVCDAQDKGAIPMIQDFVRMHPSRTVLCLGLENSNTETLKRFLSPNELKHVYSLSESAAPITYDAKIKTRISSDEIWKRPLKL